jgi:hypothetical protein
MAGKIQANAIVTVIIDGTSFGKWDVKSGGERTADITRHRAGGELEETLLGGLPTTGSTTLDRVYDEARDHTLLNVLTGKVGSGEVTVSWQPTDGNMIPTASPAITRSGRLAGAPSLGPDYDSNSADGARIEITVELV